MKLLARWLTARRRRRSWPAEERPTWAGGVGIRRGWPSPVAFPPAEPARHEQFVDPLERLDPAARRALVDAVLASAPRSPRPWEVTP